MSLRFLLNRIISLCLYIVILLLISAVCFTFSSGYAWCVCIYILLKLNPRSIIFQTDTFIKRKYGKYLIAMHLINVYFLHLGQLKISALDNRSIFLNNIMDYPFGWLSLGVQ